MKIKSSRKTSILGSGRWFKGLEFLHARYKALSWVPDEGGPGCCLSLSGPESSGPHSWAECYQRCKCQVQLERLEIKSFL